MNQSISNGVNNFVFGSSQGTSMILPKIKKRIIESGPLPSTVTNINEIRGKAESLIDIKDYYGGNVETALYYCFLFLENVLNNGNTLFKYYVFLLDCEKKPLCRLDGTVTLDFNGVAIDDTIKKGAFFVSME